MGYPVEIIGINTSLFGIVAPNAIEDQKEVIFNKEFKEQDVDCKMIGLNIKDDDLGVFLSGLKDSKIKGIYVEREYWAKVAKLLKSTNEIATMNSLVDTIYIEDGQYTVDLVFPRAIIKYFGDIKSKIITIIGTNDEAKSLFNYLTSIDHKDIIIASEIVEDLLPMSSTNKTCEMERVMDKCLNIKTDISINFLDYDIKIDSKNNLNVNRDFDKILKEIAKIKTKEWSING